MSRLPHLDPGAERVNAKNQYFYTRYDHLLAFYAPTINRTNWMAASC